MTRPRLFALCIAVILLSATVTSAQDLSRYRDYQLGMSLAAVAKQAGLKPSDARVLHQRPDLIQELEWSQDVSGFPAERDTVRRILFSFHGGQLFRIAVSYNWDRTEGMTADDMIEAIREVWTGDAACDRVRRFRSRARHHRRQGCRPLGRCSTPSICCARLSHQRSA